MLLKVVILNTSIVFIYKEPEPTYYVFFVTLICIDFFIPWFYVTKCKCLSQVRGGLSQQTLFSFLFLDSILKKEGFDTTCQWNITANELFLFLKKKLCRELKAQLVRTTPSCLCSAEFSRFKPRSDHHFSIGASYLVSRHFDYPVQGIYMSLSVRTVVKCSPHVRGFAVWNLRKTCYTFWSIISTWLSYHY